MRILVAVTLAVAIASTAVAEDPVALRLRFAPGEQTSYKLTVTGAGSSKIMNQSQPIQVTGELQLNQKIVAVDDQDNGQLETATAAGKLIFTVRGVEQPQTLPTQPVTETISPQGKLMADKGEGGATGGFTWSGLPELQKLLGSVQFPLLPERAVAAGARWNDKLPLEVGGRKVTVEQKGTLESFTQVGGHNCARIKTQFILPVEVNTPSNPLGMTESMKGTERISRTTLFDTEAGRIVRQETSLVFLLDAQIVVPAEAGKQVIPGQLELRMRIVAEAQP